MASPTVSSAPLLDDDSKYKKRNSKENPKVYYFLYALIGCALLYVMAPYNNGVKIVRTTIVTTTKSVEDISAPDDQHFAHIKEVEQNDAEMSDDYPKYDGNVKSEKLVRADEDVGTPPEEEKKITNVMDEMEMLNEEDDPSTSEEQVSKEESKEEKSYDELFDDDLFVDQEEYNNAPIIKVLPESKTRKYSKIVLAHERYYRNHPSKLYVPTLKKNSKLGVERFRRLFMHRSQPVIIPFEAMRHLNFTTKSGGYTLEELKELYPNNQPAMYKYGALVTKELDLGPAVASLMENKKLRKTQQGKSYPRNSKFTLKSIAKLGIQYPPFVPSDIPVMLPSLWFAPTSASTPLHSDCCDNMAMMITGTKVWTLAPPSEARILYPNCKGGLCWVKKLPHSDQHAKSAAEVRLRDNTQFLNVELKPGHLLYLPAGWFHHVEQEKPTVMVNFWTKGGPSFLKYYNSLVSGKPLNKPTSVMGGDSSEEQVSPTTTRTDAKDIGGTVVSGT